ncbi:hypothetical protein A3742_07460 [Oleiphilus sp. HI0071]|uniref:S8 family serine peptidase n=3 Tax=unclassified Oleiphilus TaxID=2631174 RepID=UPI0007C2F630|nr:S8 family serine peptidase [Oleiphilus sp. HI0080]KZY62931.1 hypothetical protein A3737_03735 [Oleiphilus sp. HI0065]KZY83208.1 hypothetical protein A3742_07460 [Oleiphilus sp. HI0071]KZY98843.1 hypothetical protein A3744_13090 [Oleiphilus sp. HI0073]KZZ40803.1 hypothetical protein A3758_08805 [Oleiphilus sp. HI0118]KZZ49545.1 hypothetical protein A3760_02410 [Oleiphilus sp. HI0122]KZZ74223.1 hypothetical protein A3765_11740 [Oleiphilus sp. HI0130]KZZ77795.1 hypothetical protein A3767_144
MNRLVSLACALLLTACGGGSGGASDDAASLAQAADDTQLIGTRVSLSGELFVDDFSEQDADTQITGVATIAPLNNEVSSAQRLNNPTSLGGYVSARSGNYRNGEVFAEDTSDFYSLPMLEGQSLFVTLQSAESLENAQLDVFFRVYRSSNTNVAIFDRNVSQPRKLEFVADQDDEYLVQLYAGSFGNTPVLYQLKTSRTLASGSALAKGSYAELASDRIAYVNHRGQLVRTNSQSDEDLAKLSALREAHQREQKKGERAEPDYRASITSTRVANAVNDTLGALQWNVDQIKAPDAWAASTGAGVRVAVIDTGVSSTHEDLLGNVLFNEGYDFVSNSLNGDGDGRDGDSSEPSGGTFHGTHISGLIAAESNNSAGIAGIAYDADIIPIRVLDQTGSGSAFDIADGIRYAAGLRTTDGLILSPRVDVINLSLGLNADSFVIADAVRDAVAAGVVVIAAAGNDASDAAFYPAQYPEVFGVGSVNHQGFRSLFSNFGQNVSLMAPGGTDTSSIYFDGIDDDILGPFATSQYAFFVGTSFAAPHVTAVVALMKQLNPSLDSVSFASLLNRGVLTDVRESGAFYGRGVINAEKAVAVSGGLLSDKLDAFPESLSFTQDDERLVLTLSNLGAGSLFVDSVTFTAPWLSLSAQDTDGFGLGRYAITIDSSVASDLAESAQVEVRYSLNGGAQQIKAIPVYKASESLSSALSGVYVYLVRKESVTSFSSSYEVVQSAFFDHVHGSTAFRFDDVPSGNYYLEASTDNDGDRRLFDPGEALGAYRLSNDDAYLTLNSDREGVRFSMTFQDLDEASEYAQSFDPQIDRALP